MNHSEVGIADDLGVGLARKIGADIALGLYQEGVLATTHFYSTDADVTLPENYFETTIEDDNTAAVHCNFFHQPSFHNEAQILYDLSLDYYVTGLNQAGSKYAYFSLGSALVLSFEHYAKVRGFPKRSAGEDFHLLNKLAKIGNIAFDLHTTIQIEQRLSQRVPYGTGPAIIKISQLEAAQNDFAYYHPRCFQLLKTWLEISHQMIVHNNPSKLPKIDLIEITNQGSSHLRILEHGEILYRALEQIKAFESLTKILLNYTETRQRLHQWNNQFDAVKTLRLIHALRDLGCGTCCASDVRRWFKNNSLPYPRDQINRLQEVESS